MPSIPTFSRAGLGDEGFDCAPAARGFVYCGGENMGKALKELLGPFAKEKTARWRSGPGENEKRLYR
jgi:hypothetical protein